MSRRWAPHVLLAMMALSASQAHALDFFKKPRKDCCSDKDKSCCPSDAAPIQPAPLAPSPTAPAPEPAAPTPTDTTPSPLDLASAEQTAAASDSIVPYMVGDFFSAPITFASSTVIFDTTTVVTTVNSGYMPGDNVGRLKVSENNSSLPRDRVFMNWSYYGGVPGTTSDLFLHRFSPGFEKTFFNRMTSIEVRVPFASTLDSTGFVDSTTPLGPAGGITDTGTAQLGNVNLIFKGLVYASNQVFLGGGLGVSLPTANNVTLKFANGDTVFRVENEDVRLQPYIGGLWMPNSRAYTQAFAQMDFATSGNPVFTATPPVPQFSVPTGPLVRTGRYFDQPVVYLDWQAGYWIYQTNDPSRWITAVSPIVELHYNALAGQPRTLTSASEGTATATGFGVGTARNYRILNATAAVNVLFRNRVSVMAGFMAPVANSQLRAFDYEAGVRANYFFGPVTRAVRVSQF